jgi:hypothetical protein
LRLLLLLLLLLLRSRLRFEAPAGQLRHEVGDALSGAVQGIKVGNARPAPRGLTSYNHI